MRDFDVTKEYSKHEHVDPFCLKKYVNVHNVLQHSLLPGFSCCCSVPRSALLCSLPETRWSMLTPLSTDIHRSSSSFSHHIHVITKEYNKKPKQQLSYYPFRELLTLIYKKTAAAVIRSPQLRQISIANIDTELIINLKLEGNIINIYKAIFHFYHPFLSNNAYFIMTKKVLKLKLKSDDKSVPFDSIKNHDRLQK